MQGLGIEAAPDESDMASPETYVGYERARNLSSPDAVQPDKVASYQIPSTPQLNHLVLGSGATDKAIRFRVRIDGHEPGSDHGVDSDGHGAGVVREQRPYQLIRQTGAVDEHTFTIEFLDPGVQAYSFTFG